MANLLERAIDCDDGDDAGKLIRDALGIESDEVANYMFPKTWPANREQRARIIGEWLRAEARFLIAPSIVRNDCATLPRTVDRLRDRDAAFFANSCPTGRRFFGSEPGRRGIGDLAPHHWAGIRHAMKTIPVPSAVRVRSIHSANARLSWTRNCRT